MLVHFSVDERDIPALLSLPESGMGWQHVSARVGGKTASLLVLNAINAIDITSLNLSALTFAEVFANTERLIRALGPDMILGNSQRLREPELLSQHIRIGRQDMSLVSRVVRPTSTLVMASALVKTENTTVIRRFYRFSASAADRRVDPLTGRLLPGSYSTTDSDMPMVPSGLAAVGRYALPNTDPASYRYQIDVASGTLVSFGTVAPAFGQAGGGVEAMFARGAANASSRVPPTRLPDE